MSYRTRDWQRSKVYAFARKWEQRTKHDLDWSARLIFHVCDDYGLASPKVGGRPFARAACCTYSAILLPEWARQPVIVLHELAHWVLDRNVDRARQSTEIAQLPYDQRPPRPAPHGPEFARIFCDLLIRYARYNGVVEQARLYGVKLAPASMVPRPLIAASPSLRKARKMIGASLAGRIEMAEVQTRTNCDGGGIPLDKTIEVLEPISATNPKSAKVKCPKCSRRVGTYHSKKREADVIETHWTPLPKVEKAPKPATEPKPAKVKGEKAAKTATVSGEKTDAATTVPNEEKTEPTPEPVVEQTPEPVNPSAPAAASVEPDLNPAEIGSAVEFVTSTGKRYSVNAGKNEVTVGDKTYPLSSDGSGAYSFRNTVQGRTVTGVLEAINVPV